MTARPVFVSYSQPDRAVAFGVVSHLESRGTGCWIAPRDVTPAADWAAEIVAAIAAARVMVLVFSSSTNDSAQVRREVERAVHRRVAVLPFRIEEVLPSRSLEYFLSSQHWLDAFPPPLEPHCSRLADYLEGLLRAPPAAMAPNASTGTVPVSFDAAQLRRLESELAGFIGPLARHLVKRAAATAPGAEALIVQLGAEIESEAERRRFVNACRQVLRGKD